MLVKSLYKHQNDQLIAGDNDRDTRPLATRPIYHGMISLHKIFQSYFASWPLYAAWCTQYYQLDY